MNFDQSSSAPSRDRNVLGPDVEIVGTISFREELRLDGRLNGAIVSNGTLHVGPLATLEGEIACKVVVVHGTVHANITATERCELKSGSVLHGDLKSSRIHVEEGATFIGRSEVTAHRPK